ncbi:MAG: polynucleotide adenylyltransferase PcnB [Pseudomonadota bacterium]|jgi:poly(A) polymerase
MLKAFIHKISARFEQLAVKGKNKSDGPHMYSAKELGFNQNQIAASAVSLCRTLQQAGFKAYVVGGAVRDQLLGLKPKDFDVATDAKPEQVKQVFKRAYIIGKRFRIVHVVMGREVIEVTTFRGGTEQGHKDEHGKLVSDNVYGSQAEDAVRRDFTINALYYDPVAHTIHDYVGAMADIRRKRLRLIGHAATRYTEDPVRMLRAVRLCAKTGCALDAEAAKAIPKQAHLLAHVPGPRLHDESLKFLLSGHAQDGLALFPHYHLPLTHVPLLQELSQAIKQDQFINLALANSDARVRQGKSVTEAFLFACLLWRKLQQQWRASEAEITHPLTALHAACDQVLDTEARALNLTRKNTGMMREIWLMQPRFEQRSSSHAQKFADHERFRAAYDFYLLRADAGDAEPDVGRWWTDFYAADADARAEMIESQRAALRSKTGAVEARTGAKKRRRKPRSRNVSVTVKDYD